MIPLLLLACTGPTDDTSARRPPRDDTDADTDSDADADTDTDSDTDSDTDADSDADGDVEAMCTRWNDDRADTSESSWNGSVNSCNAGSMSDAWRDRALTQVNVYRWLADLPPVTTNDDRNDASQECALMQHANNTLSHYPDSSWECYDADGASAAGQSNIATTAAVYAVDLYMLDYGNDTTLGHRRWILSNGLGPIGIGSTSDYSCMWVLSGSGSDSTSWTAYPPPGPFPVEAMGSGSTGVDSVGWSIQSDTINLARASVTVTESGTDKPVTVTQLSSGYGSTYAIGFAARGWTSQAWKTYEVSVTGISPTITYEVLMTDCGS